MTEPEKPLRVLLVTTGYPPDHSGSGGRLHQLYSRLAKQHPRLSWSVITRSNDDSSSPDGPDHVFRIPMHSDVGPIGKTTRITREFYGVHCLVRQGILRNIDLIHCGGWSWLTYALCRAAKKQGIPVIRELTSVGDSGQGKGPGPILVRRTNRLANLLVAISPAISKRVQAHIDASNAVWCRPNPVDLERFRPASTSERKVTRQHFLHWLPTLSDSDRVILHVGRIRPLKNQLLLVKAMKYLPARFHLIMVGPSYGDHDVYLKEVLEASKHPDLTSRVHLEPNYCDKPEVLMRGADVFAFPSSAEGLGNVMLEALATGLPVAAAQLEDVTDWIISPGKNGVTCRRTPEDFADAILEAEKLIPLKMRISDSARMRFDCKDIDQDYWTHMTNLSDSYSTEVAS